MASEDSEEETPEGYCSPAAVVAVMAVGRWASTSLRDIAIDLHGRERMDACR